MLICFAPVFTRGMKINYVNHILRKSEIGTLKTNPYNLPLNRKKTKMPSSAHLGLDSLAPLAVSSRGSLSCWALQCPTAQCCPAQCTEMPSLSLPQVLPGTRAFLESRHCPAPALEAAGWASLTPSSSPPR